MWLRACFSGIFGAVTVFDPKQSEPLRVLIKGIKNGENKSRSSIKEKTNLTPRFRNTISKTVLFYYVDISSYTGISFSLIYRPLQHLRKEHIYLSMGAEGSRSSVHFDFLL